MCILLQYQKKRRYGSHELPQATPISVHDLLINLLNIQVGFIIGNARKSNFFLLHKQPTSKKRLDFKQYQW